MQEFLGPLIVCDRMRRGSSGLVFHPPVALSLMQVRYEMPTAWEASNLNRCPNGVRGEWHRQDTVRAATNRKA